MTSICQYNTHYEARGIFTRVLVYAFAFLLLAGQSWSVTQAADVPPNHPYVPVLKLANVAKEAMDGVNDYQAVITKRERINNKLQTSQMEIKVRRAPFSVYLKFREPDKGTEVLFVEGRNNNKILAHKGSGLASIVGTVSLDVNSSQAMDGNRYPITMIGLHNMVDKMIQMWESETQYGECEVKYYPNAQIHNIQCRAVETSHPVPRRQFKYKLTRLYIDKETNLPIRCECYGFPVRAGDNPPLIEEYTYTNIRTNIGLTDFDFSRENPNYQF